jgi:hypothetical protein
VSSRNVVSAKVYFSGYTENGVMLHQRADGRWVARVSFYNQKYFPGQQEVIALIVKYKDGSERGGVRRYRPCVKRLPFLNKPWTV